MTTWAQRGLRGTWATCRCRGCPGRELRSVGGAAEAHPSATDHSCELDGRHVQRKREALTKSSAFTIIIRIVREAFRQALVHVRYCFASIVEMQSKVCLNRLINTLNILQTHRLFIFACPVGIYSTGRPGVWNPDWTGGLGRILPPSRLLLIISSTHINAIRTEQCITMKCTQSWTHNPHSNNENRNEAIVKNIGVSVLSIFLIAALKK